MNRIVKQNYAVSPVPADLREGLDSPVVTVTIEQPERPPEKVMSLDESFALRRPPYRTKEEIDADIRRDRDEWG
jgi:hypothetical protein